MLQLKAYLPVQVQEVLPDIKDYLLQIQIEKYLTLANTLRAIGALSASYVAYKVAKILAVRRKYAHIPGPKTKGLFQFFIGCVPTVEQMEKEGKHLPDYLYEWHQQYGPVFKFQLLDQMVVAIIDPNGIKEALVVKNFPKSPLFFGAIMKPLNIRFAGHGLVTDPNNQRWREQRSTFNPGFNRNVLMSYVDEFNSKGDILMERLRTLADGKTEFKLFTELNHTTLDAIASIAFGMNVDSINNEQDRIFSDCLSDLLEFSGHLFMNPWLKYSPFMIPRIIKFWKKVRFIREAGKQKILERMKENQGSADQTDILAKILKGSKSDSVDLELMMDNFVQFFVAGQETTANTLGFSFLELGRNRQIFDKCREEVDNVLGTRTVITYEDIPKLKYIGCVFKETLRLYPVAPVLNRLTNEEMTANGMKIPSGTHLAFSPYTASRIESNFPNPMEFKPERFIKDANSMDSAVPSYAYFPFSIGPRNCIGQNFAQIEGIIILAKFIQKFDMRLAPNQSFKTSFTITLKPTSGTVVALTLRK